MTGSIKLTVQDYVATVVMDRPPVNAGAGGAGAVAPRHDWRNSKRI